MDLIKLIIIRDVGWRYKSPRPRFEHPLRSFMLDADCSPRCRFHNGEAKNAARTAFNDTFHRVDINSFVFEKKIIPIALLKTTIQQLQLHPLHHRRKTRILMALLAVKSEARAAVKMIYSRWIQTVSEK